MIDYKTHWDSVYSKSDATRLGWYEKTPQVSLDLIKKCGLNRDATLLDVGSGTTTLIQHLVQEGYSNLIATDISEIALKTARQKLSADEAERVRWIMDDITAPKQLQSIGGVDIWHDRTVLHFLIEEKQQKGYLESLKGLVKNGGHVIIAVFSLGGAKKCSGLDVKNYNHTMISEFLGSEFELLEHLDYLYTMPFGDSRPYIYTHFQRQRKA